MKQDIPHNGNILKCAWRNMLGRIDAQLVKLGLKPERALITCEEFADLMQAFIDEETTTAERALFEKQRKKCAGCSQKLVIEQETLGLIRNRLEKEKTKSPYELQESIRMKILYS